MSNATRRLDLDDTPLMTVADFLDWQGGTHGIIYELVDGVIRAQDVPSATHGSVHANVTTAIVNHLRKHRPGCRLIITPGIRPHLNANWNHRIPEMAVTCTPSKADVRDIENPTLIVEILSPSNRADTWSNVPLYATLPSVLEIVLIESTRVGAQVLRRGANGVWPENPAQIDAVAGIGLDSVGLVMPTVEIYRDTHLEADARDAVRSDGV